MYIYEAEKKLGLADRIIAERFIKCNAEIIKSADIKETIDKTILSKYAKADMDSVDLYGIDSILVTAGWNKNDAVFTNEEMWNARSTPNHKPFNLNHDTSDIIGHTINVRPVDGEYNIIADDTEIDKLPEKFHLLTSDVIYKLWANEERDKQIAQIIGEIKEGKWFVSMECWYDNFDYAIMQNDNTFKIVNRNRDTAFLTQHLRKYDGSGYYENAKIGMVPRTILFSGKGLTQRPANPESIIFASMVESAKNVGYILNSSELPKGENVMPELDTLKAENADLKTQLAELNKKLSEKDNKEVAAQIDTLKKDVETKSAALAEAAQKLEKSAADVMELNKAKDTLVAELNSAKAELAKHNEAKVKTERANLLATEAGLEAEQAASIVDTLSVLNDEKFKEFVEKYKKNKEKTTAAQVVAGVEKTQETAAGNVPSTDKVDALRKEMINVFSSKENK